MTDPAPAGAVINTEGLPGGEWQERPFRLPDVDAATYTPEQAAAAQRTMRALGLKHLPGPLRMYVRDPRILDAMIALIIAENLPTTLDLRLIRLIAITYARIWRAQFEWFAQSALAVRDGLDPAIIEAIRTGQQPAFVHADEQVVFEAIHELERTKALSDETFGRLHAAVGDDGVAEFLSTCGTFLAVGLQIKAVQVKAPAPFPEDCFA